MSLTIERSHRFGSLQLRIMRLLWKSRLSAREITDKLNQEEPGDPTAHSTVQTLLRKLEDKGAIGHELADRTFIFYPLVREESALKKATQDFVQRLFGGSVPDLVSYLLKEEKLSPEELSSLRQLINKKGTK